MSASVTTNDEFQARLHARREQQRTAAKLGAKASARSPRHRRFTREEAREAGRKGGEACAKSPKRHRFTKDEAKRGAAARIEAKAAEARASERNLPLFPDPRVLFPEEG